MSLGRVGCEGAGEGARVPVGRDRQAGQQRVPRGDRAQAMRMSRRARSVRSADRRRPLSSGLLTNGPRAASHGRQARVRAVSAPKRQIRRPAWTPGDCADAAGAWLRWHVLGNSRCRVWRPPLLDVFFAPQYSAPLALRTPTVVAIPLRVGGVQHIVDGTTVGILNASGAEYCGAKNTSRLSVAATRGTWTCSQNVAAGARHQPRHEPPGVQAGRRICRFGQIQHEFVFRRP